MQRQPLVLHTNLVHGHQRGKTVGSHLDFGILAPKNNDWWNN